MATCGSLTGMVLMGTSPLERLSTTTSIHNNAESYNPNLDVQYLRARYYSPSTANFLTEDRYLGSTVDPLTQNRYNYAKSSPLNYADPSGNFVITLGTVIGAALIGGAIGMTISIVHQVREDGKVDLGDTLKATFIGATGGVVATATASLVGAGFAAAGITSAFTVSQAFAIGATTSAASGIAVRANTALLEGVVLPEKEPAPKLSTLEDTIKEILDPGAVTFDAAMGGVANALLFEIQQAVNKQQFTVCDEIEGGKSTQVETTRVGRWMSQTEYDKMVETGKVQLSGDNKVHVANPANIDAYGKQARKGSIYVEFDVPSNTLSKGGTDGWGIINGPGSLQDRLNAKKGLPRITEMPDATNIEIKGIKRL